MTRAYVLKVPVEQGSVTISELSFRRAKAKDFRGLALTVNPDGSTKIVMGDMMNLAARLAGVPPSVVDELDPEDLMEVIGLAVGFIGTGQPTG